MIEHPSILNKMPPVGKPIDKLDDLRNLREGDHAEGRERHRIHPQTERTGPVGAYKMRL